MFTQKREKEKANNDSHEIELVLDLNKPVQEKFLPTFKINLGSTEVVSACLLGARMVVSNSLYVPFK